MWPGGEAANKPSEYVLVDACPGVCNATKNSSSSAALAGRLLGIIVDVDSSSGPVSTNVAMAMWSPGWLWNCVLVLTRRLCYSVGGRERDGGLLFPPACAQIADMSRHS